MSLDKVWLIPLCTTLCSTAAFFLSYLIAVHYGHVTRFWPYISDSGAMPPESCIFGQLLNLAALFLAATVYLRHRQIVEFYWHRLKQVGRWRTVSCALLWVGYTSAFGISMVANFQENNVIFVHYFGALLAFGCGLIYAWAQTVFSYGMNPKLARPLVSHCRLALCICSSLFFFMALIFGPILGHQPKHEKTNQNATCKVLYVWKGNETNYREHTVGTVSEWALAICFQLYILSFVIELRHAYCHAPKLKLLAFCEEDSETGMAISRAVIDLQRQLSAKNSGDGVVATNGIVCVRRGAPPTIDRSLSTPVDNGANFICLCKYKCQCKRTLSHRQIGARTIPYERDLLPNTKFTSETSPPNGRQAVQYTPEDPPTDSRLKRIKSCELTLSDPPGLGSTPFGRLRQNERADELILAQIQKSNLRNSTCRDSGFLDSSARGSADDLQSACPTNSSATRRKSEANALERSAANAATTADKNGAKTKFAPDILPKRKSAKTQSAAPTTKHSAAMFAWPQTCGDNVFAKIENLPANEDFAEISLADTDDIVNDIRMADENDIRMMDANDMKLANDIKLASDIKLANDMKLQMISEG